MQIVSVDEAAQMLGTARSQVRSWEKKGLIRSVGGGLSAESIMEFQSPSPRSFEALEAEPAGLTSVSLFAGAGGTALGMENAGFEHVLVSEIDRCAVETLRQNRKWNVAAGDVRELDFSDLAGVDVVEGGFPCQSFSHAGQRKGMADTRGTLFHEFARAVAEIRPRVAIGENVRGLLTHDGGRTLEIMIQALKSLGYRVEYRLLRGQFLDVAQKRERLIILAVRDDLDTGIVFPDERDYTLTVRDAIGDRPASDGAAYPEWKKAILDLVPEGGNWRDLPPSVQREYLGTSLDTPGGKTSTARRLAWDEPSLTLMCSPMQKQTERCHPDETRPLNVTEYARIQSFPDDWQFQGSLSQRYKQIGNAVPVNMAFHIGMAVRRMLE